jgi:hypothetical protein
VADPVRPVVLMLVAAVLAAAPGCIDPRGQRPGLRLSGEVDAFPSDWSFTDAHREIAIQIRTPYLLPHSVTIWCASLDGRLFVGARAPETKRWPGWVERRPEVRLGVGDRVYEGRLARLEDATVLERLRRAYAAKYELPNPPPPDAPPVRYWSVEPRG